MLINDRPLSESDCRVSATIPSAASGGFATKIFGNHTPLFSGVSSGASCPRSFRSNRLLGRWLSSWRGFPKCPIPRLREMLEAKKKKEKKKKRKKGNDRFSGIN